MAARKHGKVATRSVAPKGHFVVYVGVHLKRFVLPLSYLRNPFFQQLLQEAADKFGYNSASNIILPCDKITFQGVINSTA